MRIFNSARPITGISEEYGVQRLLAVPVGVIPYERTGDRIVFKHGRDNIERRLSEDVQFAFVIVDDSLPPAFQIIGVAYYDGVEVGAFIDFE